MEYRRPDNVGECQDPPPRSASPTGTSDAIRVKGKLTAETICLSTLIGDRVIRVVSAIRAATIASRRGQRECP